MYQWIYTGLMNELKSREKAEMRDESHPCVRISVWDGLIYNKIPNSSNGSWQARKIVDKRQFVWEFLTIWNLKWVISDSPININKLDSFHQYSRGIFISNNIESIYQRRCYQSFSRNNNSVISRRRCFHDFGVKDVSY